MTVTIVVPIYGDLPSLERCIESALQFGELEHNRLLLINDCGPEADAIEVRVREMIDGHPAVSYHRNHHNLGFVGTCNRAAGELDDTENDILLLNSDAELTEGAVAELHAVLHASEKHGAVCPRSNNATIATMPFIQREADADRTDVERTRQVFESLKGQLPRYSIAPVAVGFCMMIRRQLIANYGLFDTAYGRGYSEENDFCLRVNKLGYSAVVANRALALHEGAKSFEGPERTTIREDNERTLIERYPYYPAAVAHYLEYGMDPADWFADFIVPTAAHPRVLIDLHHMSLIYDGSVRNALTFLDFLAQRATHLDVEFVIAASREAIEFFDLGRFGFRTLANEHVDELFDLGFSLAPVTDPAQIKRLDRCCARWIVSHLDIIALRVLELLEQDYLRKQVVLDALRFADRVVTISRASLEDLASYFGPASSGIADKTIVVHQGAATTHVTANEDDHAHDSLNDDQRAVVDAGGYVLVIGNKFSHKQMPNALRALNGLEYPIVAFGSTGFGTESGITHIRGGLLSDEQVSTLYARAACVVYPSAYEGFGLPVAEASRFGKKLVVFDSVVAREVVRTLDAEGETRFFSLLSDLPDLVRDVMSEIAEDTMSATGIRDVRTMDDYNATLLDIILVEVAAQVDVPALRARMSYFRQLRMYEQATANRAAGAEAHIHALTSTRSFRLTQSAVHRLGPIRPLVRRVKSFLGR